MSKLLYAYCFVLLTSPVTSVACCLFCTCVVLVNSSSPFVPASNSFDCKPISMNSLLIRNHSSAWMLCLSFFLPIVTGWVNVCKVCVIMYIIIHAISFYVKCCGVMWLWRLQFVSTCLPCTRQRHCAFAFRTPDYKLVLFICGHLCLQVNYLYILLL